VVLEAHPRDPTPADRRRRQQWRHPIHLLPGRPTAMIDAPDNPDAKALGVPVTELLG